MTVDVEERMRDAERLRRMIEQVWGYGAQTKAARYLNVSDRTMRHWLAGKHRIPPNVMAEIQGLVKIAPPPDSDSSEDRDGACVEALEPALTELRDRAVAAGWHPAEVAAAILSMTIDDIRHHAGDAQARDVLRQALAQLRM